MAALFALIFLAAVVGVFKPYIPGLTRAHFGGAAAITFILIGVTAPSQAPNTDPSSTASGRGSPSTAPANAQASATNSVPAEPESRWRYSQDRDEMRGTTVRYASVASDNSVDLEFPYGTVSGTLTVRRRPEDGLAIIFQVDRGQVLCNAFTGTTVSIRFDDGPVRRFRCLDSSDGSTETAFIQSAQPVLAQLKRARRTIIEAEFFQQGRKQFVFPTAGLRWE